MGSGEFYRNTRSPNEDFPNPLKMIPNKRLLGRTIYCNMGTSNITTYHRRLFLDPSSRAKNKMQTSGLPRAALYYGFLANIDLGNDSVKKIQNPYLKMQFKTITLFTAYTLYSITPILEC